jgi:hypothetical protein
MTTKDVAQWMLEELHRSGVLYQEFVIHEMPARVGKEFIYCNEGGHWVHRMGNWTNYGCWGMRY